MKKLVLLVSIAALAAVALYFTLATTSAPDAPEISRGETAPALEHAAAERTDAPEGPKPIEEAAPSAALAEDAQREARGLDLRATLAPERLCLLTVHAPLPEGSPADDEVEILVFGKWPDDTNAEGELAQLAPGALPPKWLIARQAADRSGTTEIALERRRAPVGVLVRGRYTTTDPDRYVDVSHGASEVTFRTRLGACVRGRLIAPADATAAEADFARAELHLRSDPLDEVGYQTDPGAREGVERETMAVAGGAFEFRGVPAAKRLTLSGRPARLAAFKSEVADLRAGKTTEVDVRLERGARLSGTVVDESGAAVAGAKIKVRAEAVMFGFGGRNVREGDSGADGSFALDAVATGASMVDVAKDGYIDSTLDVVVPAGGSVDGLVLKLGGGARVAGLVRWRDGTPAAGAKVEVTFDQASLQGMGALNARHGAEGEALADEQGRFTVTGLGKGPFTVKATAQPPGATGATGATGEASEEAVPWSARADAIAPNTDGVALVLEPPSAIAGTVADDAGQPVVRCSVEIAEKPRNPFIPARKARVLQLRDAEGKFLAEELPSGTYLVVARDEFGVTSPSVEVSLPAAEGAASVALVLPRPAIVRGRVLLPDGSPAGGARVQRQLSISDVQAGAQQSSGPDSGTDAEGRFTLRSLPMGALTLQATKDGYAPSEGAPVTLTPAAEPAELVLALRRGGTISGEVFDDRGKARSGSRILAQMPDLKYGQKWTTSDAAGRFEFPNIAPGTWQVMKFGDGVAGGDDEAAATADFVKNLKIAMATVKDGETVHVVLGAPPKNPVHVRGRLTAASAPVAGAMVSFIPGDGGKSGGALAGLALSSSDKDGVFELDLPNSGPYLVTVQKVTNQGGQQSIEFARTIPDAPQHSLEFELPLGAISGRVADAAGEPVVGARISLAVDGPVRSGTITGGRFSELQTDERGEYLLEWLAPGRYSVSAGGALFAGVPSTGEPLAREVRDGVEIAEGQRVRLDFRLRAACVLRGKVLDSTGNPVVEAGIFVRDESGRPLERFSMTATDASGKFEQKGLGAGRYLVSARSDSLVTREEVSVTLEEGEDAEVLLQIDDGTILVVTITGGDGNPIDATCSVLDDRGRQVNGFYSLSELMKLMSEGGFDAKHQRIGPLPRGKYTVEAVGTDGTKTSRSVTLIGQPERKITLKLGD